MVYPDLCITLISQIYSAAQRALDCYDQAMRRLKSGDWAGFGTEMNAMRDVLEKLSRESDGTKSPTR